jgi:hypothetical protein
MQASQVNLLSFSSNASRATIFAALAGTLMLMPRAFADPPAPTSGMEFRATIEQMQALTAACANAPEGCDASKVSASQQVGKEGDAGSFAMDWSWLRDALKQARTAKPEARQQLMSVATSRLKEMEQESGGSTGVANFKEARASADKILSAAEFKPGAGPTLWERWMAKFWGFIERVLDRLSDVGDAVPWLGTALEFLLFVAVAAVLLLFVLRRVKQQRLRVLTGEGAAGMSAWDREAEDWARMAERSAAAGDWREAVHELYWAAIVYLEARRAWRHNPTRTPREYVRLLKADSEQQRLLRGLTQVLERVWYGLQAADREEYEQARTMFDGLAKKGGSTTAAGLVPGECA